MRVLRFSFCLIWLVAGVAAGVVVAPPGASAQSGSRSQARPTPTPTPVAAVIPLAVARVDRAAAILHGLYPHASIRVEHSSNSIIVVAPPDDVQAMRSIAQGIDVPNPSEPTVEIEQLRAIKPQALIDRLHPLYPRAHFEAASKTSVLVRAAPLDLAQIKALITNLDVSIPTPAPPVAQPAEAIKIVNAIPRSVARAVERQLPHVRASVSGATVIVVGDPDDITRAKTLIAQIDQPPFGTRYTQVYRLHNVDATSVANLIGKSFAAIRVDVDRELNAISVLATAAQHERIADAIAQLDGAATQAQPGVPAEQAAFGTSNVEIVHLTSAVPSPTQGSTTPSDIATAVTQALQQMAPDLHVTVPANSTDIILSGSPASIRMAKDLIAKLDVTAPLVVLDTEVFEVDETDAKNLGLSLGSAISTTFTEIQPTPDPTGQTPRLIRLQPVGRTPISLTATLNLLVQKGNARVLADPRITTISGHTASIRAGDTISVLTTTGGGVGTAVTQQIQQFNTGVTLDITPIVDDNQNVTVALHPVVNSLAPGSGGSTLPTISTRDTQTVVALHDNQTLVIGGLIQEQSQRQSTRIPYLADLPLLGHLFRDDSYSLARNELVIVVTPHIVTPGAPAPPPAGATTAIPTPEPLPTLPQGTTLPPPRGGVRPMPTPIAVGPVLQTPPPAVTPSPAPTPTAFPNTNVFTFGSAPQNTFARDSDPPQIFYASFSPTVLQNGAQVTVSAITTSNVKRVTVGYPGYITPIAQIGPSRWQSTYAFNASGAIGSLNTFQLTLTAYRNDGATATIQIPVSLLR